MNQLINKSRKKVNRKKWGVKNHYIAQSVNHDLGISNKYFSLSDSEKETWKTETEIRKEFEEKLEELRNSDFERYNDINKMVEEKSMSVPDCAYIENNIEVYLEIITNSYGQAEVEAKERFIEIMDIKTYETERV
ncbi:hypothetical protein [Clostridium butyricum]|uniref:hypothetical protein n=1 Tax=Clostridium butyricum TaxID=1492 RepID=UPI00325BDD24